MYGARGPVKHLLFGAGFLLLLLMIGGPVAAQGIEGAATGWQEIAVYVSEDQEVIELGPATPDITAQSNVAAQTIQPAAVVTLKHSTHQTPEQQQAVEQSNAALSRARTVPKKPFRPTISDDEYAAMKAEAARARSTESSANIPVTPQAIAPSMPPTLKEIAVDGAKAEPELGAFPTPDAHIAAGHTHVVEVSGSRVDVWAIQGSEMIKAKEISLAAFLGYTTTEVLEPRVLYDPTWKRWIVTATALPESATVQNHLVAVSGTSDPTADFYIYKIDVDFFDKGGFWDYAQLGSDQDAIIITANRFSVEGFEGSDVITLAKARIYNGHSPTFKLFTVQAHSLAPPIVLDQHVDSFLISAAPSGSSLQLYALTNTSRPSGVAMTGPIDVAVPRYTLPPEASQPDTFALLDTLDARFINASTQVGDLLWQVHTINRNGYAKPKFYAIDTKTATVVQSGFFSKSPTSHDFNASIAANEENDIFVTWNATDPAAGTQAQIRFSGKKFSAPSIPAGSAAFTSTVPYESIEDTGIAWWGQYSAASVDPTDNSRAWIVNEKVDSAFIWGTGIARIGF